MNSLNTFILLELFTIRKYKHVDYKILSDFRHIISNYLSNSTSYDEFMTMLTSGSLLLDKKLSSLCLSFKHYVKKAYKIWNGKQSEFGYAERFYIS